MTNKETAEKTDASPSLTFDTLRQANRERLPMFRNARGQIVHDGHEDWTAADWLVATMGELGEAANLIKKVRREDFTDSEMNIIREKIADEFADVVIYLDILANYFLIDLGKAVCEKWNATSRKIDCPLRISGTFGMWRL